MKKILTVLLCFCFSLVMAQDTNVYQIRTFAYGNGKNMPYRILYPEQYDRTKRYPLVLFLHGSGERGSDNKKQLIHGSKLFIRDDIRQNFPCIVLMPQCPEDGYWATVPASSWGSPFNMPYDYSRPINSALEAAHDLVIKTSDEESVDKRRIYITGLSMGGMGTYEMVYRYPGLFAAAMPICGGGDVNSYDNRILKTSFWLFHGDADVVVDVKRSRQMFDKLKKLKADVKYTEYPGVNHNSWDNAFAEPDFMGWMFKHSLKK